MQQLLDNTEDTLGDINEVLRTVDIRNFNSITVGKRQIAFHCGRDNMCG